MSGRFLLACGCLWLTCLAAPAWSDVMTLDPDYSGAVRHTVRSYFLPPDFPPVPSETSYRNYAPLESLVQFEWASAGCLCGEFAETNGYLIYDLSGLFFTAVEAVLELDLDLEDFVDPNILQVYPVNDFTPAFLMGLPSGGVGGLPLALGEALFNDLQGGSALGSIDISPGSGTYQIGLNAAGLDLVNNTGGLLALGLHHVQGEVWFDEMLFNRPPRLLLRAAVPVPGSAWLLLAGVLFLSRRAALQPRRAPGGRS